ncbi:MAG: DNA repair protein RecO [Gemmatimonadota bacterium]
MSLRSSPAILLRSYPYSETSQILRFYTLSNGVLGAMAKGVRKAGGRRGAPLSTFSEGLLEVQFKETRDLQTFRDFSVTKTRRGLGSHPVRLAGGSVLGELVLQYAESEENPELFHSLSLGLDALEDVKLETFPSVLLAQLWSLVRRLGFGPLVHGCVECGRAFHDEEVARFDFASGGLRCPSCQGDVTGPRLGPQARSHLEALLDGEVPVDLLRPETHLRLASDFITYHISGGQPLRSLTFLANLTRGIDA